ncbi:AEC family transporter [Bacillaceae bacterium SIJ1]|uniref:AEC family transporter n=1 Tax=Litoribacterium kuwaitense TaxID=1398745 RepID=UPI0013E9FF33|nr:AEC family transporter [Litoribacterium kuwaitense]NGP45714.1 AEC family transporter [Litoribacterium kuwaitense]
MIAPVVPIFFIFFIGFLVQRKCSWDITPFSRLALTVFLPFLVFRSFYTYGLPLSSFYYAIYLIGVIGACLLLVVFVSWLQRLSKEQTCGMMLSSAFSNNGNYGIPLVLFAFGGEAEVVAVLLMVMQQVLMHTVGFYIAAVGGQASKQINGWHLLKMPILHGALAGLVLHWFTIKIPQPIEQAIQSLADAAVPLMMMILGMQLGSMIMRKLEWPRLGLTVTIKLVIAPLVATFLVYWMPVTLLEKQVMIILAATPAAANTTLYALQYHTDPGHVSAATFFSTLLSLFTIPLVLSILL